jgi:hypothetical protein
LSIPVILFLYYIHIYLLSGNTYVYKLQGDGILIDKTYLYNIPSKNILNDYKPKNLSTDSLENYPLDSINNIINSNSNNNDSIK